MADQMANQKNNRAKGAWLGVKDDYD